MKSLVIMKEIMLRKLAEKHLGRKPEFTPTPSIAEKPSVPDVLIPEIQSYSTNSIITN